MNLDPKRVNIVKRHVTVIPTKDVQFTFEVVCSMPTSWRRLRPIGLLFDPVHIVQIKCMQIIDPVRPVKPAKEIHSLIH